MKHCTLALLLTWSTAPLTVLESYRVKVTDGQEGVLSLVDSGASIGYTLREQPGGRPPRCGSWQIPFTFSERSE